MTTPSKNNSLFVMLNFISTHKTPFNHPQIKMIIQENANYIISKLYYLYLKTYLCVFFFVYRMTLAMLRPCLFFLICNLANINNNEWLPNRFFTVNITQLTVITFLTSRKKGKISSKLSMSFLWLNAVLIKTLFASVSKKKTDMTKI